jgi:hypothetical protein
MGGDCAWDHINSCLHHASNWTGTHDHVLRTLDRICKDPGFATTHKLVLTSEGNRSGNLEICIICVTQQTNLLMDVTVVTVRHNFKGTRHNGLTQGQLVNPNNQDHILESASANKIRNYRDTYHSNLYVAFLPACMSTSGRIHGELLCLIFFLSNKQAKDYFAALGYQPHRQEFCHSHCVFFQQNRGTTGMACAQAVALRDAPTTARHHVSAPRRQPPLHIVSNDHDRMSATSTASPRTL